MNGILFWRISMFYSSELWFGWTAHFQIFDFYYAQAPHKEMYMIQNEQKMTMLIILTSVQICITTSVQTFGILEVPLKVYF